MAKKDLINLVVDAEAINYARIASPSAKFETDGKSKLDQEWKADILITEETVEKIQSTYPNLRKKMNPITPKKYESVYKVPMPKDVEEPHILKLSIPVQIQYKDKDTGETKYLDKPQPKVILQTEDGKKEITNTEYIGNNSKGKVMLMHRKTAYNSKPIDVIELGALLVTSLVEVAQKPGQGYDPDKDVIDAFGDFEAEPEDIKKSEGVEPSLNEKAKESSPVEEEINDDIPDFTEEDDDF